jgi:hypothetical protein
MITAAAAALAAPNRARLLSGNACPDDDPPRHTGHTGTTRWIGHC